jgi:hypothetical protein
MARLSDRLIAELKKGRVPRSQILHDLRTSTGANRAVRAAAASTGTVIEWHNKGQKGKVEYRLREPALGETVGQVFELVD